MIKFIKTYLSRRKMRNKLKLRMRPIKEVIEQLQVNRDRYLKAERVGTNEKNYYKGWFDCCKWLVGEKVE